MYSALNGGRDLKQRRSGLFWTLPALHQLARIPKRLVHHCQVCGRDFPLQSTAAQFGFDVSILSRLHRATPIEPLTRENFERVRRWTVGRVL